MIARHHIQSQPGRDSRRGDVTIHALGRLFVAVGLLALVLFALHEMLTTGRPVFVLVGWLVAPTVIFLMLLNFDRFFPVWLMLIIFPIQVPVGGAFIPLNALVGACLVLVGIVRHTLKEDVVTARNFPWPLRIILAALVLAYLHNPAMPTGGVYQYGETGSGFRRYLMEGVKWSGVVYVLYYVRGLADENRLLRFIRRVTWVAILLKIAVLATRSRLLYYLIGEDLDTLMFTGYISRFFFVTAAVAGGLQVTLCWQPRGVLLNVLRTLLVPLCFVALGAGGTRSDVLTGVVLVYGYLFLRRKFMTIGLFSAAIAGSFVVFMFVPGVRERLPERYQRVFIYSSQAAILSHIDRHMAESAMGSMDWRMNIAELAVKDIARSPVIGNGVRPAPILSFRRSPEEIYRREVNFVATHNFYLDQLLLFGIPAGLVIVGWIFSIFVRGLRIVWTDPERYTHSLLGYCLLTIPPILVVGFFNGSAYQDQVVLAAVALGLIQRHASTRLSTATPTEPHPAARDRLSHVPVI